MTPNKPVFSFGSAITLIGMSGVGKSTLGKALAKVLDYDFMDTDALIQNRIGKPLQAYIEANGDDAFKDLEESIILSLSSPSFRVIATGGSVIYSPKAMAHLASFSLIIFLQDTFKHIQSRVSDVDKRGIVGLKNSSLETLYYERKPLYEQYAQQTVTLSYPFNKNGMVSKMMNQLKEYQKS
ncbi:MAG: shikimate kinase [Candidatus Margulisbacteria bacterium]|nr:shikimate kinase [Candidatus Margulisiibacteriota bacterium]